MTITSQGVASGLEGEEGDGSDASLDTPEHAHIPLVQERMELDLVPPRDFETASAYAESAYYNPNGIELSPSQLVELRDLIGRRQAQLGKLRVQMTDAIDAYRDLRLKNGLYEPGDRAGDGPSEKGVVTVSVSYVDEAEKVIVMRHGEYAPLDVSVDDMWNLTLDTQKEIKGYFQ
jgi:hypothetical protein